MMPTICERPPRTAPSAGGGAALVRDVTAQWGVFALAGPNSRTLLKSLVRDAERETVLPNKRFPWLSSRDFEPLMRPTVALRVAYTGELGRELHHPIEMQTYVFDRLMEAGEPLGPRGALRRRDAGGTADLRRLFRRLRQVDRHGLRPPRSRGSRHSPQGPDAGEAPGRGGDRIDG